MVISFLSSLLKTGNDSDTVNNAGGILLCTESVRISGNAKPDASLPLFDAFILIEYAPLQRKLVLPVVDPQPQRIT